MDLAYPAGWELLVVAVEDVESKLADALRVLTPARSGWLLGRAFPDASLSIRKVSRSRMSASVSERLPFAR